MSMNAELQKKLIQAAREAAKRSHCPYTEFPVGAAVLTADERIFAGCNIENASPSLAICAARAAICRAVYEGGSDIVLVVIYTPTSTVTPPCGACRQMINEFASEAHIYCICDGAEVLHRKLSELLPEAFGPHLL